jgi:pimeloyl-ACP methyl ester carboxylesterase
MMTGDPVNSARERGLKVHELGRIDGPTLVLLHGFSDSGLCWPDAVRRWRQDYRIVAPDARGHGGSARFDSATAGSNRSEILVADVVSLLEALADEGSRPPLLVGHSMGAGTAGIVLARRPDLVCGGVLEDPPWFTSPTGADRPPARDTPQQSVQPFRDDLEAAVAKGRFEQPLWPEIEFGPWGLSKSRLDPSLTDRDQIVRHAPWVDVAASIARPALVVTGSRDQDVLVTALSRQRLAELGNNHIEVAVVPGAGHTVRRDCSDVYHQIVDPWIATQLTSRSC